MTEKFTKIMTSNTFSGNCFYSVHLILCLTQDTVQQLIRFIRDKISKQRLRHTIGTHSLCHSQNDEAALECIMQMNSVYQAQDVKTIFGEQLTK